MNAFANAQQQKISFDVSLNSSSTLLLPIPNQLIYTNTTFELWQNKRRVNASYSLVNKWPVLHGKKYIRLLNITPDSINGLSGVLTLTWQES
ncbi:hypothetical protein [Colwellia psychrerythraea]|uniref:Uncharacterized protein n=1 Tax=Colwellia psychrerythraea (strain 34H / ATCC BAA-681) TaxID=167879 RepID=Q47U89_COLP3|nr:hypothetical protein [Colwellia psychrerythraea]AAZ28221.1 hypothetical protein CPS_4995 [Colwellia psychrerythraea 34H]